MYVQTAIPDVHHQHLLRKWAGPADHAMGVPNRRLPERPDLAMDFDQLNAFLEVARLNSFSRAAVKCFRTQPAISAQIRLLEEEVGARLFDRGGGRVALTNAGKIFHEYAERLMLLRKEALQSVADLEHHPRGELFIAANESSCLHVLPEVFAEFKHQHAAVQVGIRRGEHNDILESVLENRVDFGIVSLPVQEVRLKVVPLHRDELLVVVSPGHPLLEVATPSADPMLAGEVTAEQIVQHPLLLPKSGQTRENIEQVLTAAPDGYTVSMELDSTALLKGFAAAGLGIAFIGRTMVQAEARAGDVKLLALAGKKLFREIGLIFRRDRALSRAALAFIEIAVRHDTRNEIRSATTVER